MSSENCFIDTAFFLHYLTNDIPELVDQMDELMLRARNGEIQLITNSLVIVELVLTLEYAYRLTRSEIQRKVLAILNTPGFMIRDTDILFRAIYLYAQKNLDIMAAYHLAWLELLGYNRVVRFQLQAFPRMAIEPVTKTATSIHP